MAMRRAAGGYKITFMSPTLPGTPAAPTVLTGVPAAAGPGKESLSTKILAILQQQKNINKTHLLH